MIDTTSSRRRILQGAAGAVGLALLPGARRAAAQDVTVKFWNGGIYPLSDPNDKAKKPEDFYISKAIARFEAANPGVTVAMEQLPGGPDMFIKYRTASVAQNGPDVMAMWSGSYMLALQDFLELLNPYFSTEERSRITGWEATSADFRADSDQIYGVPAGSDGTTCIFYNKEIFAKASIEEDGPWRNSFDDFVKMLEAIKGTGVTPLSLDDTGFVWQVLAWWQAQMLGGSDQVAKLVTGDMNFSNPTLTEIVSSWQKLKDYTAPGAETMPGEAAQQLLYSGQVAMTTAGYWIVGTAYKALGENLGMVKMPNFSADAPIQNGGIGGAGTAFIVSNYSQVKDEAVAFIKHLMSKEEQELKASSGEGLSLLNVTDVDAGKYYKDPFTPIQQKWANEPSTIFWLDNLYPAELTSEILAQAQLAWTGQLSAEDFLAKIDAKRDELLGS